MNCKQNEEIIIEVEINMCSTIQNIGTISAKHLLGARVEPGLLSFLGMLSVTFLIIIGIFMEKFTIKVTDKGLVVIGEKENRMEFSAGEALMLLDILKNEETELRKMAESAAPMSLNLNV